MSELPRLYPDPLPGIHPVPEYLAAGRRKLQYEAVKAALQVPWMGVVTMAFAHFERFFDVLWSAVEPLVASRAFVEEAFALRRLAEDGVSALGPRALEAELRDAGYAERELEDIRQLIEVFSHGNYPYLLLATVARLLMEGSEMSGATGPAPPFAGRHAPDARVPFVLMEAHHADAPTRAVYADIKAVLRLPFVNTDYRALARWPSYFALAWKGLRQVAGTPAHEALCQRVHERVVEAVARRLPNPGALDGAALREAARRDGAEVLQACRLFQWLLPGLAVNVAFLRAQLARN
jgi:hypothetical protein